MSRLLRLALLSFFVAVFVLPLAADAQRRRDRRPPPPPPHPSVVLRGQVFIGGYFYDPAFGPYPWWQRPAYPYWYFPVYDHRAEVRVRVVPREAAVYVDGFYAGLVDQFDGIFQALPLPPGGHAITLFLEGYRTRSYNIYLRPGSTFQLRETMERLPAGLRSEPPPIAPPVPPPPAGSYTTPRMPTGAPVPVPPDWRTAPSQAIGFGTLDLRVQPPNADVLIDGQRWVSSDEGRFLVQIPAGIHRIEIGRPGYRGFVRDIEIHDGETATLNVSLVGLTY